jgi:tetratricopeptide (TPR) repeat protein
VILYYLGLSFWPQSLCLDYFWPLATKFWQIAPEAIALAALLAATVWAAVRRPPLGFLGVWFFLILAPTSSIMPLNDACFEHRMYLSLAAVVAGAVIAAYALIRRLARQSACSDPSATIAAVALALAVAAALGCVTFRRNRDYRTAVSIWEDTVRKRENNPRAHHNLGVVLSLINDHTGAIREFGESISLKPNFSASYVQRAIEYSSTNRFPEAIQDFSRAIELKPDLMEAFFNRARAYIIGIRRYDLALPDLNRFIEWNPDSAEAFFNRANTYIVSVAESEFRLEFAFG